MRSTADDLPVNKKKFSLLRLAGLLGAALVLFLIIVGCSAQRMVFQPSRMMETSPSSLNRTYEDVFFQSADRVRLNGWYFTARKDRQKSPFAILVCHGNAGNICHRLTLVQTLLDAGADVFAFDYRGYGSSEGKPSEKGTYLDAVAAWDWLHARGYSGSNIVALGESLGGGVACELAAAKAVGRLILQSTFTSLPDLAGDLMPSLPVGWLLSTHYANRQKLARIHVPVLVLHSRADRVIPFEHARRNFAAANAPKTFCELRGDHNDAVSASGREYQDAVRQFLSELSARR